MQRTTLVSWVMGMVLLVSAAAGCGDWKSLIDEIRDRSKGTDATTGAGGAMSGGGTAGTSGGSDGAGAVKCDATTDASGQVCKTCWDQNGVIVANDCAPTPTGGSTGGGTCTKIIDGGPSSCKDAGTWKTYGAERCAAQNLTLTEVVPLTMCAGGIESVAYVCCGDAPGSGGTGGSGGSTIKCDTTTDASGSVCKTCWDQSGMVVSNDCAPTPTGGSTGGGTCTRIVEGGPTSCKDAATWKMYGATRCAQQNLTLTDVVPLTMCAGAIESVAYVCCGVTP